MMRNRSMLCKQDKKQTYKMLKITIEVWLNHISIIGNGDMLCYAYEHNESSDMVRRYRKLLIDLCI